MIFFVGPLPPPVHGFSAINALMLEALMSGSEVKVFDLAPKFRVGGGTRGRPFRFFWLAYLWCVFFSSLIRCKPKSLYIGLSGGVGQFVDIFFVLAARLFGVRVYVHHHSFAYINRPRWFNRVVVYLSGPSSTHIVLCEYMRDRLAAVYSIDLSSVFTLSNAAFVPDSMFSESYSESQEIVVGFLSNLTAEKGVFEFIEAISRAADQGGLKVKGVLAGPVDISIKARFESALLRSPNLTYVGPVYGGDKSDFLSRLDLFLFPTQYANEAEPVTILEALSFGVPVVAINRGCIPSLVPPGGGVVARDVENFFHCVDLEIRNLLSSCEYRRARRLEAFSCFKEFKERARSSLEELVQQITAKS